MRYLDCRGRSFDDVIIYYGVTKRSDIDDYEFRNHTFKMRSEGKLPQGGLYCTAEELFNDIGPDNSDVLNINFRNVQYIKVKRKDHGIEYSCIAWVFCLNHFNIFQFSFIGNNISRGIFGELLRSNGYKNGFIYYPKNQSPRMSEVWYNPNTLYMCVGKFSLRHSIMCIDTAEMYYRRFEHEEITHSTYTGYIFKKDRFFNIPLTNFYCKSLVFNWTSNINVTVDHEDIYAWTTLSETDIIRNLQVSGICDNYNEMLKIMFNASNDDLYIGEEEKKAV